MLPYVIGGAVILGVLAWLSSAENKARQELEYSHERLKSSVIRMNNDIENARKSANNSVRFQKYIALYQTSVCQSKSLYHEYDGLKKMIANIRAKRDEVGDKIGQLKLQKKTAGKVCQAIANELNICYAWLKQIKEELARLHQRKAETLDLVRQHNQNTHNLKLAIRDDCGRGGRMWYDGKFA